MSKKKKILLAFILSFVLTLAGTFLKLYHVAFANVLLVLGLLTGLVFLYFLIAFIIKAKE